MSREAGGGGVSLYYDTTSGSGVDRLCFDDSAGASYECFDNYTYDIVVWGCVN